MMTAKQYDIYITYGCIESLRKGSNPQVSGEYYSPIFDYVYLA